MDAQRYAAQLEYSPMPIMASLVRLCPKATPATDLDEFHDSSQAHVIVIDPDSHRAAELMLEAFGADVTELTVAMGCHLFLWFADGHGANQAISYYNRMPNKMAKFIPERAARLLAQIRKAAA